MAAAGDLSVESDYDRMKDLKAFDDTHAGVKGLVDAGVVNMPTIFIRPHEDIAKELRSWQTEVQLPIIDQSNIQEGNRRNEIIDEVRLASENRGFFQVVNHGIPLDVLDAMIDGMRRFHEQDLEVKQKFYSRDTNQKVRFNSNFDLYKSRFVNWRDTLTIHMPASGIDPKNLPSVCSKEAMEYTEHVQKLGETLLELLPEALGLKPDHLTSLRCAEGCTFVCHYYPACPQPELTLGLSKHVDPGILTLLLQNQISSLQFIHGGQWVDVKPIHGSIVVNIGDLLQIMSNDKLKSVEHRVVANHAGPRISVACFFSGSFSMPSTTYSTIKELTSEDNPPRYKEIVHGEYLSRFFSTPLDEKSNLDHYKI